MVEEGVEHQTRDLEFLREESRRGAEAGGIPRWSWPSWRSTWPSGFRAARIGALASKPSRGLILATHGGLAATGRGPRKPSTGFSSSGDREPRYVSCFSTRHGPSTSKIWFPGRPAPSLNPGASRARPDAFSGGRIRFEAPKRVSSVPCACFRFPDALGRIPGSRETIQTVFEGIRAPGWRSEPSGKKSRCPDGIQSAGKETRASGKSFSGSVRGKKSAGTAQTGWGPWKSVRRLPAIRFECYDAEIISKEPCKRLARC